MATEERDIRIVQLEQRMELDDLELFEEARKRGWKLIAQGQGFFWQKGVEESVTIFDDNALVEYIRRQLKQNAPSEKPTQAEVVDRLLSQGAPEHISDHEVDLKSNLLRWLEDESVEALRDVDCTVGTAEVVTEDAVYEFKCNLAPENLSTSIENLLACRKTLVDSPEGMVLSGAAAIVVACCSPDLLKVRELAAEVEVEVKTLDEIQNPSPPEYVESLLSLLDSINDSKSFSAFIEQHKLQDVIGDRRFTPSQQKSLERMLDEVAERLTPQLSEETEEDPEPAASLFSAEETTKGVLTPQMHPSKLERHPSLLMRAAGLNEAHVADLEQTYREGGEVDPIDVFYDGTRYLVADGNHRHEAATQAGVLVDVNIHKGDLKAALIFALKSNAQHGLKLSDDDKRLKALTLLSDRDWFRQSDSHLATIACGITQPFISKVRRHLTKLKPFLFEDEHKLSDEDLANSFNVPTGLVRMIRRLPAEERESLTQNILSDTGRRVGADNVVRTVPAKNEEPEAPLFEGAEQAEDSQEAATIPLAEESKAQTVETPEEQADEAQAEISEEERAQSAPPAEESGLSKIKHLKEVLQGAAESGRTLSRLRLEDLGFESSLINSAVASGDIAQPEIGKFTLPPKKQAEAPATTPKAEKPPIEEMLKGGMLAISFVFIPGVKGSVQVTLNRTSKPETACRVMVDSAHVRGFSERVMTIIKEELAKKLPAVGKAAATKKAAASKKSVPAKKPAARATKAAAKKAPAKKGAKPSKGTSARARR